jgi:hypothetical protein
LWQCDASDGGRPCSLCAKKGLDCDGPVKPKGGNGVVASSTGTINSSAETVMKVVQEMQGEGFTIEDIMEILCNARHKRFAPTPTNILFKNGFSSFVYPQ